MFEWLNARPYISSAKHVVLKRRVVRLGMVNGFKFTQLNSLHQAGVNIVNCFCSRHMLDVRKLDLVLKFYKRLGPIVCLL